MFKKSTQISVAFLFVFLINNSIVMFLQNAQLSMYNMSKLFVVLILFLFIQLFGCLPTRLFCKLFTFQPHFPQFTRRLVDDLIHAHIKREFLLNVFYIFDIVQKEFYTCLDLKRLRFWRWIRTRPQRFVDRQRLKPLRKPLALTSTRALLTMIMLMMMLSLAATGPRQTAVRAVGEPHTKRATERESADSAGC